MLSKGIQGSVPPSVASLYKLLESDFDPLNLCHKLEPLLAALDGMTAEMAARPGLMANGMPQSGKVTLGAGKHSITFAHQ